MTSFLGDFLPGDFLPGLVLGVQVLDARHALLMLGFSPASLLFPLRWLRSTMGFSWVLVHVSLRSACCWLLLAVLFFACVWPCP